MAGIVEILGTDVVVTTEGEKVTIPEICADKIAIGELIFCDLSYYVSVTCISGGCRIEISLRFNSFRKLSVHHFEKITY